MTTENINSGKEIIDAAQNAVMQAADDVSGIIENTAEQLHGHEEIFYQSAEFWVGVAFVLVVLLLAGPVGRLVRSMLNKRIDNRNCWPIMKKNFLTPIRKHRQY